MIPASHTLGVLGISLLNGEVLLVRTSYGARRWQLPGGFVEPGEALKDALCREIREELGVDALLGEVVGVYIRLFDSNLNIVFRITLPDLPLAPKTEEILEVGRFRLNALPKSISPRTRRIIEDAAAGSHANVVEFYEPEDTGSRPGPAANPARRIS